MKALLRISAVLAAIVAPSAFAGFNHTFIPTEPTIESPTAQSVNVSRTPRMEGSLLAGKHLEAGDVSNIELVNAEWIFYETPTGLQLFTGQEFYASETIEADDSVTLDFPVGNVTFGGLTASKMKIEQVGIITLLDENDVEIAKAEVKPTAADAYQSQTPFVALKTYNNGIKVQWAFKNADGEAAWDNTAQVTIIDTNEIIIELENNDFSDAFFNLGGGRIGCAFPTMADAAARSRNRNPSEWKLLFENDDNLKDIEKFSAICSENDDQDALSIQYYNTPSDITLFAQPEVKKVTSDAVDYALQANESLDSATNYTAQVRYTAKSNEDDSINQVKTTTWSNPITFITEAGDVDYQITQPSDLNFTLNQAKNLTFTLKNAGTEAGNPRFILELPLNTIDGLNGTLSDFYDIASDDAECSFNSAGQLTTMTCQAGELAANESIVINATVTVRKSDTTSFNYKVCEPALCESTNTTSLDITTAEAGSNGSSEGGSSSGGGGAFFLLLTALPFLRRRSV